MSPRKAPRILWVLSCGLFASSVPAVTIPTVPVGNPGNPGELSGEGAGGSGPTALVGSVSYTFRMGKFEITAGQYADFLNAVARTDTYGLYHPEMDITVNPANPYGCNIVRTGSPGDYQYSVAPEWANRPADFVSWANAARFANWMHNGQPVGVQDLSTTEDGSYFLNGAVDFSSLMAVTRKPDATWVLPTEDEWYKSAYHKNDGPTGNYWDYPTSTDIPPSNVLVEPTDPGNNATFGAPTPRFTIGSPYWKTEVGAHENSKSPYGTLDQGGNVWELTETGIGGSTRVIRGGSFNGNLDQLHAEYRVGHGSPVNADVGFGFRLALVPEPLTAMMFVIGAGGLASRRGQNRR
jgi:formylglycine-generating enzyme required for sulfatase activity